MCSTKSDFSQDRKFHPVVVALVTSAEFVVVVHVCVSASADTATAAAALLPGQCVEGGLGKGLTRSAIWKAERGERRRKRRCWENEGFSRISNNVRTWLESKLQTR